MEMTRKQRVQISDETDFKRKAIMKNKDTILLKGSIQRDFMLISIYVFNIGAPPKLKTNTSRHKGIDRNTIVAGDFNTLLSSIDKSSWQRINKVTDILNDKEEQLYLIDIFSILYQKEKKNHMHSFLVHMEHFLAFTTYSDTKQASTNLRAQKSSQVSSLSTMAWNFSRNQPQKNKWKHTQKVIWRLNNLLKKIDQQGNHRVNKKIHWDKWQWKYNHTKSKRWNKNHY